jgi:hypothetical protein
MSLICWRSAWITGMAGVVEVIAFSFWKVSAARKSFVYPRPGRERPRSSGALAHGAERERGRQRPALLHAADGDVEAQAVEVELDAPPVEVTSTPTSASGCSSRTALAMPPRSERRAGRGLAVRDEDRVERPVLLQLGGHVWPMVEASPHGRRP